MQLAMMDEATKKFGYYAILRQTLQTYYPQFFSSQTKSTLSLTMNLKSLPALVFALIKTNSEEFASELIRMIIVVKYWNE